MNRFLHSLRFMGIGCLFLALLGNSLLITAAAQGANLRIVQHEKPNSQLYDKAIQRLIDATGNTAQVSLSKATGKASFVHLQPGSLPYNLAIQNDLAARLQAMAFLQDYGQAFGIRDARNELTVTSVQEDITGAIHVGYQQVFQGVTVFGGVLRVHFDPQGRLTAINGTAIPDIYLDPIPTLGADEAGRIALALVSRQQGEKAQATPADLTARTPTLTIYRKDLAKGVPGADYLVYEVEVTNELEVREFVYVNAHSGEIVDQITGIYDAIHRRIYDGVFDDAHLVWEEGDPPYTGTDATEINRLHDYAEDIYNLFSSMTHGTFLSWNSTDGVMHSVANFNPSPGYCPNANWNGTSTNFCSEMNGDDTVGHEWGHAYTQSTQGFIYQWQSGALSESYSDIWGEVIDQINGAGRDTPNALRTNGGCTPYDIYPGGSDNSVRWLQGEDDAAMLNRAMRDMWNPSCEGDPNKVSDTSYACTTDDQGGVHKNCGVPNHAFALVVDGGTFNSQTVTGIGLTKASHIYWRAESVYQTPTTDFINHADALEQSCQDLMGQDLYGISADNPITSVSAEKISQVDCDQLHKTILAVELRRAPTQCNFQPMLNPNTPAQCSGSNVPVAITATDWESGLGKWTAGNRAVVKPSTFDTPNWSVIGSLPDGRPGQAVFADDNQALGDCAQDDESGVIYLESPDIYLPTGITPLLAFDHWVATEMNWDGGNLKVSVNGGAWTLVPSSAFTFNTYNQALDNTADNTNPMKGEMSFTGTDGGKNAGSWGQSQVNLSSLANPGDTIRLRFELGKDGCNGIVGWYVDQVKVYRCTAQAPNPVYVDDDYTTSTPSFGIDHFKSIQDGINAAGVGGTVNVTAGIYDESVILNKATSTVVSGDITIRGSLTIQTGTFTAPGGSLSLRGSFTHTGGTFDANGGTLTFNSGASQNLTLNTPTTFQNMTITGGTTLIETEAASNATVAGSLTNNGIIRKILPVPGAGAYDFGLVGAVIQVVTPGTGLTSLQVDRMDANHPNAGSPNLQTGKYWDIVPSNGASGFNVTLTLPVTFTPATDGSDKLCRYTGSASSFECGQSSENTGNTINRTLTRSNISHLSSWTAGRNSSPTAITLRSLNSRPASLPDRTGLYMAVCLLGIAGLAFFWRRRNKSTD